MDPFVVSRLASDSVSNYNCKRRLHLQAIFFLQKQFFFLTETENEVRFLSLGITDELRIQSRFRIQTDIRPLPIRNAEYTIIPRD
jgi:hypothetical protein